jgi:hypothetical protein
MMPTDQLKITRRRAVCSPALDAWLAEQGPEGEAVRAVIKQRQLPNIEVEDSLRRCAVILGSSEDIKAIDFGNSRTNFNRRMKTDEVCVIFDDRFPPQLISV